MNHRHRRVYLSGGMEYAADEGRDWRGRLQEWLEGELGCTVFNPNHESERFFQTRLPGRDFRKLKEIDPSLFQQTVAQLVDLDCREIAERTDYVLCYWDESAYRGAGTKGELTMARYFRKPVYMVTRIPQHEIPGWVLGCTTKTFPSFDDLKTYLQSTP
jgi:hypothetical protein